MEAKSLFLEGGIPVEPHLCGRCNRIWESADSAERCCTCGYCGEYIDWQRSAVSHPECGKRAAEASRASALEKAELQPLEYDGPLFVGDQFFLDAGELLDFVDAGELPEFGFCATYENPWLSLDDLMQNVADGMHEDWEPNSVPELAAGIENWNKANENNGTYWEDTTRKWSRALLLARVGRGA